MTIQCFITIKMPDHKILWNNMITLKLKKYDNKCYIVTKRSGEEKPAFLIYFSNLHRKKCVAITIILLLCVISKGGSKSQRTSNQNLNTLLYFNDQGAATTDENYIPRSFNQTGKLTLDTFIHNMHIRAFMLDILRILWLVEENIDECISTVIKSFL